MESDSDDMVVCAAAYYVVALSGEYLMRKVVNRKRRWWMDANKRRKRFNGNDMLVDLTKEPSGGFPHFCRMSSSDFEYLLSRIGPMIGKRNTNMRESIPIQERLAVTLRFLASGDSYASLAFLFKISKQTVSRCVDEVCKALIEELKEEVIKLPQNEDEWLVIAKNFEMQWNFPNCLGVIGGKQIAIQCPPPNSATSLNHKGHSSVVLLALVDADYCFTYVDIGCQDRISDGGVYDNSSFISKLQTGQLNLPPNRQLPSSDKVLPCVFLGDSTFGLSRHLMKPFPDILEKGSAERVFNYRLCRARRVVENVFGIMASVFRVLRKPMLLDPEKVTNITLTCVLLHNFLRKGQSSATIYTPPGTFDTETDGIFGPGTWRNDQSGMTSFVNTKRTPRKTDAIAKAIRTSFAEYFITSGKLPW